MADGLKPNIKLLHASFKFNPNAGETFLERLQQGCHNIRDLVIDARIPVNFLILNIKFNTTVKTKTKQYIPCTSVCTYTQTHFCIVQAVI